MTLRVVEGWDYYPSNPSDAQLGATGWSGAGLFDLRTFTDTAFGYGRCMGWAGPVGEDFYKFMRGLYTDTYVMGMRVKVPTTGETTNSLPLYGVYGYNSTSSRTAQWAIGFDRYGAITFTGYNNGSSFIQAKTLPFVFVPGNWFYLELKITPGYTTGAIEIRVNTVPVLVLNNVRTVDGSPIAPAVDPGLTHVSWQFWANRATSLEWSADLRFDDFYFLSTDGAINNDFLGNVRVKFMAVIGESSVQWDIGGSSPALTNWQSVLNFNLNDNTFVSTSTVGDTDLYTVDPNLDTPFVYGVEVAGAYRQDDATQRFVRNVIKSGSTTLEGSEYATNQTYTFSYDIFELNPDTGLPFTQSEANSLEIGPKLTV